MIQVTSHTRILVAVEPVDFRNYVEWRIIPSRHLSEGLVGFWPAFFSCF